MNQISALQVDSVFGLGVHVIMSYNLQQLTSLPIGSLDAYIYQVNNIAFLTAEEEHLFATKHHDSGDLEAARQLILSHLRYVVRIARGYLGYGLPLNDLIQEGNIGLMKAVKRFDPTMGVRFVSFAVHWIKAEIHEFVLKNWRIVKIATTKAQRKLFFNMRQMKQRLGWLNQDEVTAIAADLGVSANDVWEMEQRLNAMDAPYDGDESTNDTASEHPAHNSPASYLYDATNDPALICEQNDVGQQKQDELHAALATLDERSQTILKHRWLNEDDNMTLQSLAMQYGISAERVRQLEKNALKKLKQQMNAIA